MTTNDIDAIRELTDAATPGPWRADDSEVYTDNLRLIADDRSWVAETLKGNDPDATRADSAFIAAARTHVPALCDEIEQLRDKLRLFDEVLLDAYYSNDQVRSDKRTALGRAERLAAEVEQLRADLADLAEQLDQAEAARDRYRRQLADIRAGVAQ